MQVGDLVKRDLGRGYYQILEIYLSKSISRKEAISFELVDWYCLDRHPPIACKGFIMEDLLIIFLWVLALGAILIPTHFENKNK